MQKMREEENEIGKGLKFIIIIIIIIGKKYIYMYVCTYFKIEKSKADQINFYLNNLINNAKEYKQGFKKKRQKLNTYMD